MNRLNRVVRLSKPSPLFYGAYQSCSSSLQVDLMELLHSPVPLGKKIKKSTCDNGPHLQAFINSLCRRNGRGGGKKKDHISLHSKESEERGSQSSLFEMSVLGAASESRTDPSAILISCLTKTLVPHGREKKGPVVPNIHCDKCNV